MPPDTRAPANEPATDIPLYLTPRFSYYAGHTVKNGTDIFVTIRNDRPAAYFLMHWSERQNDGTPISEMCVIRLIRSLAVMPETVRGVQFVNLARYVPEYYERPEKTAPAVFPDNDPCGEYAKYFRQGAEIS